MSGSPSEWDLPVADQHESIRHALAHGAHLLTAGELHVLRIIQSLPPAPARLFVRLSDRTPDVFILEQLEANPPPGVAAPRDAATALCQHGLADGLVGQAARLAQLTVPALASLASAAGRDTRGPRAALLERVADLPAGRGLTWLRIRHRGLLRRVNRLAQLRASPEPKAALLARLGHVRWADYPQSPGSASFTTRSAMLAWEALLDAPLSVDAALDALRTGTARAPGRLDLRRRLRHALEAEAQRLTQAGDLTEAEALWASLAEQFPQRVPHGIAHARVLERMARHADALARLQALRPHANAAEQRALAKPGRRLARSQRSSWPPDRPLKPLPERSLQLPLASKAGPRPSWACPDGTEAPVEQAVLAWLAHQGRTAIHAENSLWTTLLVLVLHELLWLPLPGALPAPYLDGPLDLGSPAFAAARAPQLAALHAELLAGKAASRVAQADDALRGLRIAGAAWDRHSRADLLSATDALGPAGLIAVLWPLLERGWGAARGLPDLLVLPGEPALLNGAFPSQLDASATLVEVKGPGDTLRDEQAAWADALIRGGVQVALWHVRPT